MSVEWSLRAYHDSLPKNDFTTTTWGHPVQINRLGFREKEFVRPKPRGTYRIMVLGDSLTWGAGLAEEERYSNLMERELRKRFPSRRMEVLNFGMRGGPTVAERDLLARNAHDVEPDLVVVGFCVNDPQPKGQDWCVERERYDFLFRPIRAFQALGLRRTAEFLAVRGDQLIRNVGLVPDWIEALDRAYDPDSVEWKEFERALIELRAICDARALPPPVFAPLLQGTGDFNEPNRLLSKILEWCSRAEKAARNAGCVTVDSQDDFKKQGYRDRAVNRWDPHPSRECNEIFARNIAEHVAVLVRESDERRKAASTRDGPR